MSSPASPVESRGSMSGRPAPLSPKEIIEKYAGTVPPRPAALQASLAMATNAAPSSASPRDSISSAPAPPSALLKDSSLLLGSTLMSAGCQTAFSPNPLGASLDYIAELGNSQLLFHQTLKSWNENFSRNVEGPLLQDPIKGIFDQIPKYTAKCSQINARATAVKKRLAKLRARSEALAENIVDEAKQKALKRAMEASSASAASQAS